MRFIRWGCAGWVLWAWSLGAVAESTTRVSVSSTGVQSDRDCEKSALSADGRFAAFHSASDRLVPGDTNQAEDIFVRELRTGTTTRVSVSSPGEQANGACYWPTLSGDGRYVAFQGNASNLVPDDRNSKTDIFVHDRQTGVTVRATLSTSGVETNDHSQWPSVSADGRAVAFQSRATNLVPGDTNGVTDVFVRDLVAGTTERVSVSTGGVQGNGASELPSIGGDGRFVAFQAAATNLVPGDTNARDDVFVRDRAMGATVRASVSWQGVQGNGDSRSPSLCADGSVVAFESRASNLIPFDNNSVSDIFVRDLGAGTTVAASVATGGAQGNDDSVFAPALSGDGRVVVFSSYARNLVADDRNGFQDVFARDLAAEVTERISVSTIGLEANSESWFPAVSGDGRFAAFQGFASNLVPDDTNGRLDVFVRDRVVPSVRALGPPPHIGAVVVLALDAIEDPGADFVAACSRAPAPGIPVGDGRTVPLHVDGLFLLSLSAPAIFEGFRGSLDGNGQAVARIHLPEEPWLVGFTWFTAFVTLRGEPPGIGGISRGLQTTVVP